jgi:hypothetical protein
VALCRGARTGRARGVVTVHSPHMGQRGGTLVGDKVLPTSTSGTPRWRWARRRGHGRIRRGGGSTTRRRERRRAVAFNSGKTALVVLDECGEVLQLEGDKGGTVGAVD